LGAAGATSGYGTLMFGTEQFLVRGPAPRGGRAATKHRVVPLTRGKEFEKLGASERAPVANRRAGFQPAPQGGKIFAVRIVRLTNNSAARLPAMLYAFRLLIKSPLFTIVAIMTLAIAIGANTAIFTLVDALLLRALPYRDPDRLVMAWANSKRFGRINMVTTADFANWKTRTILDEVGNAGICTGSAVRRSNRRNFS
jgi:hypothetical protein